MSALALFLFPTIVSILSQLIRKKRLDFNLSEFFSWCFFSLLFVSLTLPVFHATGDLTVQIASDGLPMFSYTKLVPFALLIASILLGFMYGREKNQLQFGSFVSDRKNKSAFSRLIPTIVRLILHFGFYTLIFLTLAYFWAKPRYFNITFEEIFFYMTMPLQGTALDFTQEFLQLVALPTLFCILFIEFWVWFPFRKNFALYSKARNKVRVSLFPLRLPLSLLPFLFVSYFLVLYPVGNSFIDIDGFISSRIHQSLLIEEEYVDPQNVSISFPEKKRNLICIYVESAETTSQDVSNGGIFDVNYIPEMTRLANENISFSQSNVLHGASIAPACGWTIAGLVAETAGIPLKFYKYQDGLYGVDNLGSDLTFFLPGVTSLGDILEAEEYRNVFMAGSDFEFGGRRQYFSQHGNYEVFDLLTAKEKSLIPNDYMVGWGFEDEKLYAYAKDVLTELSASSQPFNFSMITVDTHAPLYPCRLCPTTIVDYCGRVLACSSAQLDAFIQWCKEQPFYENTTIAVMGDHASMLGPFYDQAFDEKLSVHSGSTDRLVYNAFINAAAVPVQNKNRQFTTMDFFPTILASMGVSIEGDRLGLGTNLFSEEKTLSEKYGYETLFSELAKKSIFYDQELLYP